METRRLLLAALLSMVVLLLWQKFFPPPEPVVTPAIEELAALPTELPPAATAAVVTPPPAEGVEEGGEATEGSTGELPIEGASSREVVLENERVRAVWSNRGAQLTSFELKRHPNGGGGTVDLVRRRQSGSYPFGLVDAEGAELELNGKLFAVNRHQGGALFSYRGSAGSANKRVTLRPDGLMEVTVEAAGSWRLVLGPGLRNPGPEEAKSRFASRAAIYRQAGDVERVSPDRTKEAQVISATALDWVGLQDQYFLVAALPVAGLREAVIEPVLFDLDDAGLATFIARPAELSAAEEGLGEELRVLLTPEAGKLEINTYFGSKQLDQLAALPASLEEAVELGIFGFLAKPLLIALRWIHSNMVGNYGWAIILLTIALRIVLFPLNHKSIASMQKMQSINPKMQAIRAKYRPKLKDKKGRPNADASAKMNQEIMALYKSEGVNPAAGCLPMVLQMPVLFAFYRLLSTTVELRQAPWMGWIHDLSVKDPYYILPLVMGASMILQQKMTPAQGDPMQRRMMMMMPVVFTFLFLGFPAGMVLYWLTNNILAIAQQMGYKRWRPAPETAVAERGGKKK